jgi:hypothetical protein
MRVNADISESCQAVAPVPQCEFGDQSQRREKKKYVQESA